MKTLKAALFDLDGTLFDTEGQYTVFWGKTGAVYHPELPDFADRIKGTTLQYILQTYFPDPTVQRDIVAQLDAYEAQMDYKFFPGALELLTDLRRHGVKCAVVTSSAKPKMRSVEASLPDFNRLFDRVLTAEDFAASKPAPDCYLLGAKVFGCTTDECVVFEDAINGLKAGTSAGIFTFGMATTNKKETIRDLCDYVLDGFEGLSYERIVNIVNQSASR